MATTTPMSGLTSRNPWARLLQGLVSGASLFTDGVVSGREAEEKRKDSEVSRKAKKLEIEKNTPPAEPKSKGLGLVGGAGGEGDPPWAGGFPRAPLGPRLERPVIPDPYAPELPQLPEFGASSPKPRWSYRGSPRGIVASPTASAAPGASQDSGVLTRGRTPPSSARRPVTPAAYAALVRNGVSQYAEHVGRAATAEERRDIEALIARKISDSRFT